ncbi:hypothetical protein V5O48_018563, partial [Marasmius crinis-equi]
MDNALNSLQGIFDNARKEVEELDVADPEWNKIFDDYLDLQSHASEIRVKHLQESSKWWEYVGVNPRLMPVISRWYTGSEKLKRRILKAQEREKQNRFDSERYRRRNARGQYYASPGPSNVSAYENPFRSQSEDAVNSSNE